MQDKLMKKILFCFGTRPEVIKMAPLIKEASLEGFDCKVCLTGQHKDLIKPFLSFFELKADYELDIMTPNQSLCSITSLILSNIDKVIQKEMPDYICVQGDTSSTFSCALAGYYHKVPIIHLEAGLRTDNIYSPFPEEVNRRMVSTFASLNLCPSKKSLEVLESEKRDHSYFVGNTSIDALRLTLEKFKNENIDFSQHSEFKDIDFNKKIILVTTHRRENHGPPLEEICQALHEISNEKGTQIVIPVHPNPNVKNIIENRLQDINNIFLINPLNYPEFVWLMNKAYILLTDSGGIQEEATFLKKPTFILRENTEREEVINIKSAVLVGTNKQKIIENVKASLSDKDFYNSFRNDQFPYGNGKASKEIVKLIKSESAL